MRILTINTNQTWREFQEETLAKAKKAVSTREYQGETLNFRTLAGFFAHFSMNKWRLLNYVLEHKAASEAEAFGVRELARRLKRDVKRVHEDAQSLVELGLLEKTAKGALFCPYDEIRIDMVMKAANAAA